MTTHLKIQFVIADGARARWVERSADADDFVTVADTKAEPKVGREQDGQVFEGIAGRHFSVEERASAKREHGEAFAREVAEAINAQAASGAFERLAVVAPARTLGAITRHLSAAAKAKLVKTLAKDLSQTPDHELGTWLRHLELG